MDFFADERANELRNLFFESAQELLQTLNEEGLSLEKDPASSEIVRDIRRTVHTLKGDSAACGYRELSELSHALEDVLTPEIASRAGAQLAELVLSAADTFDAMLAAYRNNLQPPVGDSLREMIHSVASPTGGNSTTLLAPKFDWSEYEQLLIAQSAVRDQHVYNVALAIDAQNPMRSAAVQLIRNVMQEVGTILVMRPDENTAATNAEVVEAAICTHHEKDWIEKKCKIPSVVSRIVVQDATIFSSASPEEPAHELVTVEQGDLPASDAEPDLLGILSEQETVHNSAQTGRSSTNLMAAAENILRVDAERIDNVLDLVGELIIGKSMLLQVLGDYTRRYPKDPMRSRFVDAMAFQQQVLNKLQRSVMKIRMVPVEQLFRRFPRVVRDVSKAQGKDVQLVLEGETTDLDKSILDALSEPLTHLVRNAVDHGIETPGERRSRNKPAQGTVKLNAFHQGNQVVIEISDDGRGIDPEKVTAKAIRTGIITPEDAARLSENEKLNLIFHAGLSTSEIVTDISGRGVGMDIVKACMERLKGIVSIQTEAGVGTTFRLKLPLTLAIIKALLFRIGEKLYAIPLSSVMEITRISESEIHMVDSHEVIRLREEVLTLVRLSDLGSGEKTGKSWRSFVIVISLADRKFGLIVDRLVGEEELVIKALDDHFVDTEMVSGASILGDGTVVLILNLTSLVDKLGRTIVSSRKATAGAPA
ncbi:MAG TPA: chemotaxis protein CheA [Terriglobales bacterium]